MIFGNFMQSKLNNPHRGFLRAAVNQPGSNFQQIMQGGKLFDAQVLQDQQFRDQYMYRKNINELQQDQQHMEYNQQIQNMDIKSIQQPTKEQFIQFQKLILVSDWDGIRYWHHQNTPWLNQESVEKCILLYKQEKEQEQEQEQIQKEEQKQ